MEKFCLFGIVGYRNMTAIGLDLIRVLVQSSNHEGRLTNWGVIWAYDSICIIDIAGPSRAV